MKAKTLLMAGLLASGFAAGAMAQNSGRNSEPNFAKSTDCAAAYKAFRRSSIPVFFAVAEGSKFCYYTYCGSACRTTNARSLTDYRCEKESGASCKVYGPNDSIPGINGN